MIFHGILQIPEFRLNDWKNVFRGSKKKGKGKWKEEESNKIAFH